jgi:uncharacterized protein
MNLVFWLVLVVLVVLALKKKSRSVMPPDSNTASAAPTGNAKEPAAESMVCCARCQIYLPASEAVHRGEQVYCCDAHADNP